VRRALGGDLGRKDHDWGHIACDVGWRSSKFRKVCAVLGAQSCMIDWVRNVFFSRQVTGNLLA